MNLNLPKYKPETYGLFALTLIFTILSLSPLLQSGYFNDDMLNSQVKGIIDTDNWSLLDFTAHYFKAWIANQGRFYPLAWYLYAVFYYIDSVFAYKLCILIFICGDIIVFAFFLKRLIRKTNVTYLSVILLPLLFQFRNYHDPVLSYHFLLQIVFLYSTASLLCLQKSIEEHSRLYAVFSVMLYMAAILTYEITCVFFTLFFVVALIKTRSWLRALKYSIPFCLISALCIMLTVFLRSNIQNFDPGYTINFNIAIYVRTLFKQVMAAFPLFYYFANPNRLFVHDWTDLIHINAVDIVCIVILMGVLWRILKGLNSKARWSDVLIPGSLLTVLPGLLISLAPKHQAMAYGLGYLPVYIQYFGVSMMAVSLYLFINNLVLPAHKLKTVIDCLVILTSVGVFALNAQNNRTVVNAMNMTFLYPRHLLESSLENGLLENVPEGATILIDNPKPWENKYVFYMKTHKKYDVLDSKQYVKKLLINNCGSKNSFQITDIAEMQVWKIKCVVQGKDGGYVISAKIHDMLYNVENFETPQINAGDVRFMELGNLAGRYKSVLAKMYQNTNRHISEKSYKEIIIPITPNITVRDCNRSRMCSIRSSFMCEFDSIYLTHCVPSVNSDLKLAYQPKDALTSALLPETHVCKMHCVLDDNRLVVNRNDGIVVGTNNSSSVLGVNGFASQFEGIDYQSALVRSVAIKMPFTIEVILYPYLNSVPYAGIIGNHPGRGFDGFVVQQDGSQNHQEFSFAFGNGSCWVPFNPAAVFLLEPYKWHYLVFTLKPDLLEIFDNGALIKQCSFGGESLSNSGLALAIGNWIGNDRPFSGVIEEVCISEYPKEYDEIHHVWNDLRKRFRELF